MSRFSRLEVLNTMVETGLVPVFYNGDVEVCEENCGGVRGRWRAVYRIHESRRLCAVCVQGIV